MYKLPNKLAVKFLFHFAPFHFIPVCFICLLLIAKMHIYVCALIFPSLQMEYLILDIKPVYTTTSHSIRSHASVNVLPPPAFRIGKGRCKIKSITKGVGK